MIDADVDETFRSEYLWMNGDIEPSACFDAHRNGERWFVSRFDTPRGVLLCHFFGYFPLQATHEETVQFGHQFLIERWAELRELVRAP